jgi:hypothetical protein
MVDIRAIRLLIVSEHFFLELEPPTTSVCDILPEMRPVIMRNKFDTTQMRRHGVHTTVLSLATLIEKLKSRIRRRLHSRSSRKDLLLDPDNSVLPSPLLPDSQNSDGSSTLDCQETGRIRTPRSILCQWSWTYFTSRKKGNLSPPRNHAYARFSF